MTLIPHELVPAINQSMEIELPATGTQADENAGGLIAELIIERQLQKIKAKAEFKQKAEEGTGEEKW
jgi:hypothetical protein